ncbi:hypothetical protein CXB51_032251 [Gossypium anomalum]|uniref:Uncharacterized protein n=1 Tax=Gossypium anomalum TaxID=47600 RepID=A0A8J5YCK1_9ROSI|nr:hypothetical protein CXB51_032251 [Gossypium anomalum]
MASPLNAFPPVAPYLQPGWFIPPALAPTWSSSSSQSGSTLTSSNTQPQAYIATPETVSDNAWYPDSGAIHYITHSPTAIDESSPYNGPGKVYVSNGTALPGHSTGQSSLLTRTRLLYMRSLLHVPGITKNLLSRGSFEWLGASWSLPTPFKENNCQPSSCPARWLTASASVPFSVWHSRLGHLCKSLLTKALSHCNIPFDANKDLFNCVACHLGKERNLPLCYSNSEHATPLQLVVANVWGPTLISSNGFLYYMAFTDTCTRYTWVYFMRQKSEVYLSQHGILHRFSCPYTSAQNVLVERKHRQLVEVGLSMLAHASMPLSYWNDAFASYSHLHKGYRCLAFDGKIYVSRSVTFHEAAFPFKNVSPIATLKSNSPPPSNSKLLVLSPATRPDMSSVSVPLINSPVHSTSLAPMLNSSSPNLSTSSLAMSSSYHPTPTNQPSPTLSLSLNSYPTMITCGKAGIFKLRVFLSSASSISFETPLDIHEALQHESWKAAVHNELQALLSNDTWSLCLLPSNSRAIRCKWLFKVKRKADRTVDQYKARLVAKGFSQHAGLDFRDTFSPVVRAVTIRIVLAVAVMQRWPLRQIDVKNTFLNGKLIEDIYMVQPPGFKVVGHAGQPLVCKLKKALYGLRQAPPAWFHTLRQFLVDQLGFHASKADPSLFVRTSSSDCLFLMVYVDDIVITSNATTAIDNVVMQLHHKFALKDMGHLNFFLGIEVQRKSQELFLNQKKYILEILKKAGMLGAAVTFTPMVSTPKLVTSDGSPSFIDSHLYRSVVGMLQYLCITRPDLSFCVNKLSQFMNSPSELHWKAVKRVLRYLIGTMEHGLCFSKGQFKLECYCDVDWASSLEDRLSTIGYVVYLGPNPIAWCSKKQAVVSRSSSEVEYRSLTNCVSELLWVRQLLEELGIQVSSSSVVWCDNTSTVSMAANPTHHTRVKHVEIDHHFVREKVLDGSLQINFVPSTNQVADVLTQPITSKHFTEFRNALQVLSSTDKSANLKENGENVRVTSKCGDRGTRLCGLEHALVAYPWGSTWPCGLGHGRGARPWADSTKFTRPRHTPM